MLQGTHTLGQYMVGNVLTTKETILSWTGIAILFFVVLVPTTNQTILAYFTSEVSFLLLGCPDVVLTQALCALVLPDAICMRPLWIRLSPSACKSCSEQRSMHSHLSSISQGEPWGGIKTFQVRQL